MWKKSHPRYGVLDSRGHLSVCNGLLTYDDCNSDTDVPANMKEKERKYWNAFTRSQGITTCREHANMSVWWSGVLRFSHASSVRKTNHLREKNHWWPQPYQQAMAEGVYRFVRASWSKYLELMNYYSRFIQILSLVETTSQVVIQRLKSVFTNGAFQRS